ncbi:MAG: FkbM family methyltransferase [Chitinophagaceae bacterium]
MIVTITNALAGIPNKKIAGGAVSLLTKIYGSRTKVSYNKKGYWSQEAEGWIVHDVFPNVRLRITEVKEEIKDIFFNEYTPKQGDVCIDVGAGIGTETMYAGELIGTEGKLYAIEAAPLTYQLLCANVASNHLNNVTCSQLAITDVPGTIRISSQKKSHEKNSIFTGGGENVNAITMDDLVIRNNIQKIDFLKVNIEGAEKLLIRQFNKIKIVHHAAIACHDFLGRKFNDETYFTRKIIEEFMSKNNFEIYSRNTGIDYKDDWVYGRNKDFEN